MVSVYSNLSAQGLKFLHNHPGYVYLVNRIVLRTPYIPSVVG